LCHQPDRNLIQAPTTGFTAWKAFGVDQQHLESQLGTRDRGGSSCGTCADDGDVAMSGW
jgi:hypothetical protein